MKIILGATLAATLATTVWAEEKVVHFQSEGQEVTATLNTPDGAPAPVVLMLHGFTGSRDELAIPSTGEGIFQRTAQQLADAGFASLRIDFRGSGESLKDLSFADTTFESQVSDALAALDYLKALDTVSGDAISILGWSQGGLVATATAGRSKTPQSVLLWNAVADPDATYGGLFGAEFLNDAVAADAKTDITGKLPWGAEVTLKGAFFDQVASFEPAEELAHYDGPVFVAQGNLDTVVTPDAAQMLLAAHKGEETYFEAEMDHVFNVFSNTKTLDSLVQASVTFLNANSTQ